MKKKIFIKIIFPICAVAYLAFVTLTMKPTPKSYSLDYILDSIGSAPKSIAVVLLLIAVLVIVMIEMYISAKKNKEEQKDAE